jgi:hypothetical protein
MDPRYRIIYRLLPDENKPTKPRSSGNLPKPAPG